MSSYIQWYASWTIMIFCGYAIAAEIIMCWRRVLPNLRPPLFIGLIIVSTIYSTTGTVLVLLSIFGGATWKITVHELNYLSLWRMYLSTGVPVVVLAIFRFINFRAKRLKSKQQEQLREIGEELFLGEKTREEARAARVVADEYIQVHSS